MKGHGIVIAVAGLLSAPSFAEPLRWSLSENFNANTLAASLDESGGSPEYANGAVSFRGWVKRTYLRTKLNYDSTSFVARLTVSVAQGHQGAGGAFIGVGAGFPECAYYAEPRVEPAIYTRIFPFDFEHGAVSITNANIENLGLIVAAGGDGTHRVQLVWNHELKQFSVSIHQNYAGGPFTPTASFGPIAATDRFGRNNTRLFFGGAGVYDDLAVVAIEAKKHGDRCAADSIKRVSKGWPLAEVVSLREAVAKLCAELSAAR